MADEQLEWVFDSLVEFLRGPIWNIPVLTFIEQKSVVFEPGAENEEEMKKIHEAYKNLVDFMLGSYMEDLRITPDEFEKSCSVATKKALNQFHQSLFQQVWAADDFEIFRRMMTQKNLELQLQALEFLTQKRGSVPNCMEAKYEEDEEMLQKAIEEVQEPSESETNIMTPADTALQEKMKLEAQKEKELLEQAIKQSVQEKEPTKYSSNVQNENQSLTEEPPNDTPEDRADPVGEEATEPLTEPEPDSEPAPEPEPAPELEPAPEPEQTPVPPEQPACKLPELNLHGCLPTVERDTSQTLPPLKVPEERPWTDGDSNAYEKDQAQVEVTPLELEKRQQYLREQRDRLLALKKRERARRLSASEEVATNSRPRSARAARCALREEPEGGPDPHALAFRKSLAAKLRSEVIDKVD